MHNPTRRAKRFKRFSTRPPYPPPESSYARIDVPGEDDPPGSSMYVRHRQAAQFPDVLRGAMLVALVVVTIVLYVILWELEQSSFTAAPRPNADRRVPPPGVSTGHPHASTQGGPGFPPGEQFNVSEDWIAFPFSKPGLTTHNPWPPPITRVPEESGPEDLAKTVDNCTHDNEHTTLASFDSTYCNGPCRFLLPVRIGEQESKARMHLTQLLMLAQRLNRTLVLPNVGKSRLSVCSEWHFGAYYNTSGFAGRSDAPAPRLTVGLEAFTKWVNERPVPPCGFVISMQSIPQDCHGVDVLASRTDSQGVPLIVEKAEVDPKIGSCLESKLPRLHWSLPWTTLSVTLHSGVLKTDSNTLTRLVQLLSNNLGVDTDADFDLMTGPGYDYDRAPYPNASHLSLADVDVLVLDYALRHPLFPTSAHPDVHLDYAPALVVLADRIADNLGLFLGVHWRMETVPVQNLAWCAASLVSTLQARLQDDSDRAGTQARIKYVWLATDHPHPLGTALLTRGIGVGSGVDWSANNKDGEYGDGEGPLNKSSTFKARASEHDDAIGILVEAFQPGGDLDAWALTDLAEQLRRYPYVEGAFDIDNTLLRDPGVLGILDKLVLERATVFVSGTVECSKTRCARVVSDCPFEAH